MAHRSEGHFKRNDGEDANMTGGATGVGSACSRSSRIPHPEWHLASASKTVRTTVGICGGPRFPRPQAGPEPASLNHGAPHL